MLDAKTSDSCSLRSATAANDGLARRHVTNGKRGAYSKNHLIYIVISIM